MQQVYKVVTELLRCIWAQSLVPPAVFVLLFQRTLWAWEQNSHTGHSLEEIALRICHSLNSLMNDLHRKGLFFLRKNHVPSSPDFSRLMLEASTKRFSVSSRDISRF